MEHRKHGGEIDDRKNGGRGPPQDVFCTFPKCNYVVFNWNKELQEENITGFYFDQEYLSSFKYKVLF